MHRLISSLLSGTPHERPVLWRAPRTFYGHVRDARLRTAKKEWLQWALIEIRGGLLLRDYFLSPPKIDVRRLPTVRTVLTTTFSPMSNNRLPTSSMITCKGAWSSVSSIGLFEAAAGERDYDGRMRSMRALSAEVSEWLQPSLPTLEETARQE